MSVAILPTAPARKFSKNPLIAFYQSSIRKKYIVAVTALLLILYVLEFNQALEHAGRVRDFLEFAELMCLEERKESCGGHFRLECEAICPAEVSATFIARFNRDYA